VNSDRDDLIIEADPDQMEQVFINLFHNAIEAMDGAGTLEAAIESQGDVINISVSDTGKGIPPEVVAKLFEPFFSTKDKGTGLGLAITFNIIQKHGGEIRAESETGKGSAFYITLPKERDNHVV
jgi:signal transduction histidine kinase